MKIGLFRNAANNMYILSKQLRRFGLDAHLLLDRTDTDPMSQPSWEELSIEVPLPIFYGSGRRSFWKSIERKMGWHNPPWVKEVGGRSYLLQGLLKSLTKPALLSRIISQAFGNSPLGRVLVLVDGFEVPYEMSKFDFLIVTDLGPFFASLSKKPYFVNPYGSDLFSLPFRTEDPNPIYSAWANFQRRGLAYASKIFSGDPDYATYLERLGLESKFVCLPLLADTDRCRPMKQVDAVAALGAELAQKCEGKFLVFVPSRQDFQWKGSDKIIRAFARLASLKKDVFMLAAGWGVDLEKSFSLADQLGVWTKIYFFSSVFSKPKMVELYNLANVVIDQFNVTGFGSIWREAMSCGRPVISRFDSENYEKRFSSSPPMLAARDEEGIFERLLWCYENNTEREQLGSQARSWIMEHYEEKSLKALIALIKAHVS